MAKWLTALFALFLSLQVFGARGKAVDKFLGSCFMPGRSGKIETVVRQKAERLESYKRLSVYGPERMYSSGQPLLLTWLYGMPCLISARNEHKAEQ